MAPYIPFANTKAGCEILKAFFPDAAAVRVTLDRLPDLKLSIPTTVPLWIDPAFEGFANKPSEKSEAWQNFIGKYPGHDKFEDARFLEKPNKTEVQAFVNSLLDDCLAHSPARITIPQWPVDLQVPRFKLNRILVEAAATWRANTGKQVDLVLPIVFTHQRHLENKAARTKTLSHIKSCAARAQFEGIWSVDSSMGDQDGTGNFEERFNCVIKFFEEIREIVSSGRHLTVGPHWGLNLVLWVRGLVDHPAICLGSAFKYYLAGKKPPTPKTRVALSPLRRWATYSPDLKQWLSHNAPLAPTGSSAHKALTELQARFGSYADPTLARKQISQFYKEWFLLLDSTPPAGRALALYQDLSSAYVLGKNLRPLPSDEGTAKRPERVAQQLMLHCL